MALKGNLDRNLVGGTTNALGLDLDLSKMGLGVRSRRYSMLVENGVVKQLNIEEAPAGAEKSGAGTMLQQL